jgi:HAD superfamily hydrolase (TIGR01509 family)
MNPALVIFDCDGVLVDSERMEVGTIAAAGAWLGAELDAQAIHERHRGGVFAELFASIERASGAPLPDGFPERYRELQLSRLESVELVPGAESVVGHVVSQGLDRCIVSGGPMVKMEVTLKATGLWDQFAPHIFSCYDITDHKPSPGIYLHAMSAFGVVATDCVAIEDSTNGVRAAAAAQVPVIGLARDTTPADLIAAGATVTVASMHDVPAAIADLGPL